MGTLNPLTSQYGVSPLVSRPSKWDQLNSKMAYIRLCTLPKVGRIWADTNRTINSSLVTSFIALESRFFSKKCDNSQQGDLRLKKQRSKAVNVLSMLALVTNTGVLASAIASLWVPPVAIATLTFALATFTLKKAYQAVSLMALKPVKDKFIDQEPISSEIYINAIDLMKRSGVKYLETNKGLKTRTDLCLDAYYMVNRVPSNETHQQKQLRESFIPLIEQRLRSILAGKEKHRNTKAVFGLMPSITDKNRITASSVEKGFGTVDSLIPIAPNPALPDEVSVVGLLQGHDYGSQTQRPDIKYTLRNLAWKTGDQKDFVDLLATRKMYPGQRIALEEHEKAFLAQNQLTDQNEKIQHGLNDSIFKIAGDALESLTPSDTKKAKDVCWHEMTPSGQAVVYAAQKIIRQHYEPQSSPALRMQKDPSIYQQKILSLGKLNLYGLQRELDELNKNQRE